MGKYILKSRSYDFAVKIIKLSKTITREHKEFTPSKLVLKSGTTSGASIRKVEFVQHKADFINIR